MTDQSIAVSVRVGDRRHLAMLPPDADIIDVTKAYVSVAGGALDDHIGVLLSLREAAGDLGAEMKEEDGANLPKGPTWSHLHADQSPYAHMAPASRVCGKTRVPVDMCDCGFHVKQPDGGCLGDAMHPRDEE